MKKKISKDNYILLKKRHLMSYIENNEKWSLVQRNPIYLCAHGGY